MGEDDPILSIDECRQIGYDALAELTAIEEFSFCPSPDHFFAFHGQVPNITFDYIRRIDGSGVTETALVTVTQNGQVTLIVLPDNGKSDEFSIPKDFDREAVENDGVSQILADLNEQGITDQFEISVSNGRFVRLKSGEYGYSFTVFVRNAEKHITDGRKLVIFL